MHMAEGGPRPEAGVEAASERKVGDGLAREVRQELAVLDPVAQELPSEEEVFASIVGRPAWNRERNLNWRNDSDLNEALRAEIRRVREGLVAKRESARGAFEEPTRKTPPPPNPYA